MANNRPKLRITFNSPAVLIFALACVAVQVLNVVTHGASNRLLFSTYRSSLLNPLTWLRCVTHVLGHADWGHLLNNMMLLLVVGPAQEEKYGSANVVFVMLATAVATAVVNMVFFPNVALLGASGIVFAMILLSSITSTDGHTIPLTFILVAALYVGQQVWQAVTAHDNVSYMAHIAGGAVGAALGFGLNKISIRRR